MTSQHLLSGSSRAYYSLHRIWRVPVDVGQPVDGVRECLGLNRAQGGNPEAAEDGRRHDEDEPHFEDGNLAHFLT